MSHPPSLVERKRLQARQRIIAAADELFHARGFDAVSVSDIAARAEVGRTTFFRHFGDKQEVVFAEEQELLDAIAGAAELEDIVAAQSPREAVEQLCPVVLELCATATSDPPGYVRHFELVDRYPELRARDALKMQQLADRLTSLLAGRGTDPAVARWAAQISLACFQTARSLGNDPRTVVDETRAAFELVLEFAPEPA